MDKNINSNKVGCLCIWAQKAVTTWLNQQLLRHPELYLPPIKEAHYFDFLCSQKDRIWIKKLYQLRAKNRIQKLVKENEINWKDIAYYSRISALIDSEEVNEDWYHSMFKFLSLETQPENR